MRKFVVAIAAAAAMSLAGAAKAAVIVDTYTFTTSETFGDGNFGTVTVTDNGINLYVAVALAQGYEFRAIPDSSHHDLVFKLDDTGLTIQNILSNVTAAAFQQTPGTSFDSQPFKGFNYAIDCKAGKCIKGWKSPDTITHPKDPTTMGFKIAGVSINDLSHITYVPKSGSSKKIFFAADVQKFNGYTGSIGATWTGEQVISVPEPTTWALMIMGFGSVGAFLRRRRAATAAAA